MDTRPPGNLRLLLNRRRTAKRYLAARGLRRPTVPWEPYAELEHQSARTSAPRPVRRHGQKQAILALRRHPLATRPDDATTRVIVGRLGAGKTGQWFPERFLTEKWTQVWSRGPQRATDDAASYVFHPCVVDSIPIRGIGDPVHPYRRG